MKLLPIALSLALLLPLSVGAQEKSEAADAKPKTAKKVTKKAKTKASKKVEKAKASAPAPVVKETPAPAPTPAKKKMIRGSSGLLIEDKS